jgi:hypothetical protein
MKWKSLRGARPRREFLAVTVVIALVGNPSLYGGTVTWTSVTDGPWSAPGNWASGTIPDSTSDVVIDPGTVSLDIAGPNSINSLNIGSGSTLTINTGSSLNVGPSLAPAVLLNAGTINVSTGSELTLDVSSSAADNSAGTISVADGGTLGLIGPGTYFGGTTNLGSGTSGATLRITGDVTLSSGALYLSDSSANLITGVTPGGSLTNDYSAAIYGAGKLDNLASFTNNGLLSANQTNNALVVSTLTNWDAPSSTLTGGSYSASNVLQLSDIGAGTINTLSLASVAVDGVGLITGNGTTNALSALTNISNSAVAFTSTPDVIITPVAVGPAVLGTLSVSADDSPNGGFASLALSAANLTIAGNLSNSATGVLNNASSIALLQGSTLTVQGDLTQLASSSGFVTTSVAGSTLHVTGNTTQTGSGMLFTSTGGPGATGIFDGQFKNLDLGAKFGSGLTIEGGSSVTTKAFQNDQYSEVGLYDNSHLTTNAFNNNGTVTLCGCSVNELTVANGDFTNGGGTVYLDAGNTLTVINGNYSQMGDGFTDLAGTLKAADVVLNGGVLVGLGTIDGNLENNAIDNPGDPGTQTITGNYTQGLSGLLILDFAGTDPSLEFDNLLIGGNVSLSGELQVDLLNGYTPTAGDSFKILSWAGTLAGDFTSWNLPTFNGLMFTEIVESNDILLRVSASTATPEPSTFLLMALFPAMLLGTAVRRRVVGQSARG